MAWMRSGIARACGSRDRADVWCSARSLLVMEARRHVVIIVYQRTSVRRREGSDTVHALSQPYGDDIVNAEVGANDEL